MGAAFLAGLAVGFWKSLEELETTWTRGGSFEPKIGEAERASELGRWAEAVKRSRGWNEETAR
jgi:glycerol kinase